MSSLFACSYIFCHNLKLFLTILIYTLRRLLNIRWLSLKYNCRMLLKDCLSIRKSWHTSETLTVYGCGMLHSTATSPNTLYGTSSVICSSIPLLPISIASYKWYRNYIIFLSKLNKNVNKI